jgi:uncharacterized protein YybS (DUF2232 family)
LEKISGGFFHADFYKGTVISSVCFMAAAFLPLIGSVFAIFAPLPVLYYYLKAGRLSGVAICAAALLILFAASLLFNEPAGLGLILLMALAGVILAESLKREYSVERAVIIPSIILYLIGFITLLYQSFQLDKPPFDLIESFLSANIQESISIYAKLGMPAEQITEIKESAGQISIFLTNVFPSLVLVATCFAIWLNVLTGTKILRKNKIFNAYLRDLSNWRSPEKIIWLLIAGAAGLFFLPNETLKYGCLNAVIVCFFIYLLQGLAIISFLFKRKNIPAILRSVIYFLIFAQQYIFFLVVAVGLFDIWVNFRRYIRPSDNIAA